MKRIWTIFRWGLLVFILAGWMLIPMSVHSEVESTILKQINLHARPLDVASSADGKLIFILVQGEILVHSIPENKVSGRIPIDKAFDRMTYSQNNNALILTSSSAELLRILQLELIHDISLSGLPFKGPADAPITIAVFMDYQWPYCARLEPLLRQVLDSYPKDVKLVNKSFPLAKHRFARSAAAAALAANEQGKFWAFHDKLFESQKVLNHTKIQETARELGLDMERFDKDRASEDIIKLITRDINEGKTIGIRGIPTVFVNGKHLKKRSLKSFQEMIDREIEKKK